MGTVVRFAIACSCVAVPGLCVTARAEPPGLVSTPSVRIMLPQCDSGPLDQATLMVALGEEISFESTVFGPALDSGRQLAVSAESCSPPSGTVSLTMRRLDGSQIRRAVGIGQLPEPSQPRAIALAAAEMLHAEREAARQAREAAIPGVAPATGARPGTPGLPTHRVEAGVPSGMEEASVAPATPRLEGEFGVRLFPRYSETLLEARGGLANEVGGGLYRIRLDAGYWRGSPTTSIGAARIQVVSFGGTIARTWNGKGLMMDLGPRVEAGKLWVDGVPANQTAITRKSADDWILTCGLSARLGIRMSRGGWLSVGADVGSVLWGLEVMADHAPFGGIEGPMVSLRLGGSVSL